MAFGRTNDYVETPAASVTPEEMEQTFYSALSRNTFIEGNITTKDDLVFSAGLKGNINSTKIVLTPLFYMNLKFITTKIKCI